MLHATWFSYYLCTVLSPRNRIRNIYSEYNLQIIHVFWTTCVPVFFKDFGTLTSNSMIFGDEKRTRESIKLVEDFIAGLSVDRVNELIRHFVDNITEIRYIYSLCNPTYYYNTLPSGLNIKLGIDSNIRSTRKRKLDQLERIANGESKNKTSAIKVEKPTTHPMEQATNKSPTQATIADLKQAADKLDLNYGELASTDGFWKSLKTSLAGRPARDAEMARLKATNFAEEEPAAEKPVVNI